MAVTEDAVFPPNFSIKDFALSRDIEDNVPVRTNIFSLKGVPDMVIFFDSKFNPAERKRSIKLRLWISSKKARTDNALTGCSTSSSPFSPFFFFADLEPIPSIDLISSISAFIKASMLRNLSASSLANCSPISRMPKPKINRQSSRDFDSSIDFKRLSALLSLKLPMVKSCSRLRL